MITNILIVTNIITVGFIIYLFLHQRKINKHYYSIICSQSERLRGLDNAIWWLKNGDKIKENMKKSYSSPIIFPKKDEESI